MNREHLAIAVREATNLSGVDAARTVDAIFDSIAAELRAGAEVKLTGFGTFLTRDQSAYAGRNPRTGASVDVPARRVAKFRPSDKLML